GPGVDTGGPGRPASGAASAAVMPGYRAAPPAGQPPVPACGTGLTAASLMAARPTVTVWLAAVWLVTLWLVTVWLAPVPPPRGCRDRALHPAPPAEVSLSYTGACGSSRSARPTSPASRGSAGPRTRSAAGGSALVRTRGRWARRTRCGTGGA